MFKCDSVVGGIDTNSIAVVIGFPAINNGWTVSYVVIARSAMDNVGDFIIAEVAGVGLARTFG